MNPRQLPRLLRTLRHLRLRQMAGQGRRLLLPAPRPARASDPPPRLRVQALRVPYLGAPAHARWDGGERIRLINREVQFEPGIDWDFVGHGMLWAYHLHQFEWVRCAEASPRARFDAMRDWMTRHRTGVGWHAGPISLRAISWLKLLTTPDALPDDSHAVGALRRSLASQLNTLAKYLEVHLLANHYLWNLLALVYGGLAFEGERAEDWLAHEALLREQLDEQVLPDGAHYERSPMYHALLLENVLDLLNLAGGVPEVAGDALAARLRDKAARMLGALRVWTHPDGDIALFADSAFGVAKRLEELEHYATALGVEARGPERSGVLDAAGYVRLAAGPFTLIASVAGPMPTYQPGHAHCDALSFELSVGRQRVVTDTGVSEYIAGELRDLSRATRSHATLQIADQEQAECWAAHRIGGRPEVTLVAVEPEVRAEAVCSGWATPRLTHRRAFEVRESMVTIRDELTGGTAPVRLHLPFAPGLTPRLADSQVSIALPEGGCLRIELPRAARWRIVRTPYFPEFGSNVARDALLGEATALSSAEWRFVLARD